MLAQHFPGLSPEYFESLDPFHRAEVWGYLEYKSKRQQELSKRK